MLLNDAIELGAAHEFTGDEMKSVLMVLRWPSFEKWIYYIDDILRVAQQNRPADEIKVSDFANGQGENSDLGCPLPPLVMRRKISNLALVCI